MRTLSPAERTEPLRGPPRPKGRRRPPRRRTISRTLGWISGLLTSGLILVAALAGAVVWFQSSVNSDGPLAEARLFTVERNARAREIALKLEQAGVIASRNVFMAYYFAKSGWRRFGLGRRAVILKAGEYEFEEGVSLANVVRILEAGRVAARSITFPEGRTSAAIVAALRADDRLVGEITEVPGEGVLFPATYDVRRGMTRMDVLQRMYQEQQRILSSLWETRAPDLPISSPHEALILASIVQREMGPRDDPKRIAAVFHNRLRKGMRLQSDPTILYGVFGGEVNWGSPIYRSQIREKTAYNTYQIDGLPPTPICNPGRAALEGVLQPAQTDDLYFVADGRGGHFFARTLEEHNVNVRKWREIEREIRTRRAQREAEEAEAARRVATTSATPQPADAEGETSMESRPVETVAVTVPTAAPDNDTPGVVPLPVRKPRSR